MTHHGTAGSGKICQVRDGDPQRAIEEFAASLDALRRHAGTPSFARISSFSKKRRTVAKEAPSPLPLPKSTASDAVQGKRLPTIATVLAFVEACQLFADDAGMVTERARFDLANWQHRWREVRALRDGAQRPVTEMPEITGPQEDFGGADNIADEDTDVLRDEPLTVHSIPARYRDQTDLMIAHIARRAGIYSIELEAVLISEGQARRSAERAALGMLEDQVTHLGDVYDPPPLRRRNALLLADVYFEADAPFRAGENPENWEPEGDVLTKYVQALLAAEVEYHGPVRLNFTQKTQLAEVYEHIGFWMTGYGLYAHAAFAFQRAALLHYQLEDPAAQERCQLWLARALRRQLPLTRRLPGYVADLLCGYGYRPFRMLPWMVTYVALCAVLLIVTSDLSASTALQLSVLNFFRPAGLGDTEGLVPVGRAILMIESLVGALWVVIFAVLFSRRALRIGGNR